MEKRERIEVYNREDAWKKAQELFPGDYEQDELGSKNAGYPVYRQVGGPSWISDIGTMLELTIVDAKGNCETIRIWIEDRKYTAAEVREIVTAQRKELEAINAIRLAAEVMKTNTGEAVIELLDRLEWNVKAKLEQFGI